MIDPTRVSCVNHSTLTADPSGELVWYKDWHAAAFERDALARKCEEMERQLIAYRTAVNEIDDRIEYRPFERADIHAILATLTAHLSQGGVEKTE